MQPTTPTSDTSAEQYLSAGQVWERYGVTSMTMWRWLATIAAEAEKQVASKTAEGR